MFIKNGDLQPVITTYKSADEADVYDDTTEKQMKKALDEASKQSGKVIPVSKTDASKGN